MSVTKSPKEKNMSKIIKLTKAICMLVCQTVNLKLSGQTI